MIEVGFGFTEYRGGDITVRNYVPFVFGEKWEESRRKEEFFIDGHVYITRVAGSEITRVIDAKKQRGQEYDFKCEDTWSKRYFFSLPGIVYT